MIIHYELCRSELRSHQAFEDTSLKFAFSEQGRAQDISLR
jgi:hypothetical protein